MTTFVPSSAVATHTAINTVSCPHISDGAVRNCSNAHTWQDSLAYFTHTMKERYWSADPNSVWFYQSVWTHDVIGGNPHYLNYWIVKYPGATAVVFDDYYGHPLFWYPSGLTLETGVNSQFQSYPSANMLIRNTDFSTCAQQPLNCVDYGHRSWIFQAAS